VDDTVAAAVMAMVRKKFPNEYDYGVFLKDDTTLAYYHPLEIILIHDYNRFDTSVVHGANLRNMDFTPYLQRAVAEGAMHPESFGMLNDRSGGFRIGRGYGQEGLVMKMKGHFYYDKSSEAIGAEIERNRAEAGLCSRELGRAKLIYNVKNNANQFILAKSTFGLTFFDFDMPEKVIKNAFVDSGVSVE
jgi:hypothetical protein